MIIVIVYISKTLLMENKQELSYRMWPMPPQGELTPNLKNVEVTVQNKLHDCRKFSGKIASMKINKEQQLQKYDA